MIEYLPSEYVLPDKAYDCDGFISLAKSQGALIVIPPKKNRIEQRNYDRDIYGKRHLVECFFAKIKRFRRISTRYEKLEITYRAAVLIAACMVWLQ